MELVLALPPTDLTNEAFLREVDEGLRQDQMLHLWRRWGRIAAGVLVAGLIVFGGFVYFQSRGERIAGKQGEQFDEALGDVKAGQAAKADPVFEKLAASGAPGYRTMARFAEAQSLIARKDTKGAITQYTQIANDGDAPQSMRDLALIRQTLLEYDTMKPEAVVTRLSGLATPDSPWFGSAGELVAAAWLRQGKRDVAGKLFKQLAESDKVPGTIRQRAADMANMLGVAVVQSEEKKVQ